MTVTTEEYYWLTSGSHCIPRDPATGEVKSATVGKIYTIKNPDNKSESIQVKCTQSHPTALLMIK